MVVKKTKKPAEKKPVKAKKKQMQKMDNTASEPRGLQPVSSAKIEEWLSPTRQIDLKLQKCLDDLPKSYILLAIIKVQEYSATNIELIKYFAKKGVPGVFVSINKPLEDLAMDFPKEYLETNKVSFIDCISRSSGAQEIKCTGFSYIDAPNDLVELTVAMEKAMEKLDGVENFVAIDSISTLLIYNKPETVEKFVHSIAGKMRVWKAKGILIMVESTETRAVAETLGQFCDKVIKIE